MGVVNVTPDSFSDGGLFLRPEAAVAQGIKLAQEGAAILDVGGESTRKDAAVVPADEEMRRVLPVVQGLRAATALVSIDTMKADVADAAIDAGAAVVNDVRGLQGDPELPKIAARHGAGVIAMHNPGLLGSAEPMRGDPVLGCLAFFERSLDIARRAGIGEDRIVLDPGFGFGKSQDQNLELLHRFAELNALGFPVLAGTSRKSFIGKITGREGRGRLIGTLATNVAAALAGAAIVRVHDVAEHVDAMRVAAAIRGAGAAAEKRAHAALGLGGNVGEVRAHMAAAIAALSRHPDIDVEAVSALYKTPPWGKTDQPDFLNAAVRIGTRLAPAALLEAILAVERSLGRHRTERWGPRTIDIDILLFGELTVDEPGLRVPHPRLTERAFALAPLLDVMPEAKIAGTPAGDWLAASDRAGMQRIAEPGWNKTG